MKQKRFDDVIGGDEERVLLSGTRRTYPGVEIMYLRHEEWDAGRVYISISRDSEAMTIDQFEIFIATFKKIIEVARRKEEELKAIIDNLPNMGELPQIEMNYDSTCPKPDNIMYIVNDMGGSFSCASAEKFADLMEKLLKEGRNIDKLAA